MPLEGDRELSTPSYFAYIKIAEGCDNNCTYCAIPMIRGGFRSRTMESIVEEARALVEDGAKELILIAQDTTRYGIDLYGEYKLPALLKELCKLDGLRWLRILYCYPDCFTDELIDVIASEEKIVKYVDLPLQHASAKVLKRMGRKGDRASLTALIEKMRARIPGLTLRTTFITGVPGETEEDFTELAEFVKEIKFDRMGCFAYSQEENTPAARLPEQIDEEVRSSGPSTSWRPRWSSRRSRASSLWAGRWKCWWKALTATPSATLAAVPWTPRTLTARCSLKSRRPASWFLAAWCPCSLTPPLTATCSAPSLCKKGAPL